MEGACYQSRTRVVITEIEIATSWDVHCVPVRGRPRTRISIFMIYGGTAYGTGREKILGERSICSYGKVVDMVVILDFE